MRPRPRREGEESPDDDSLCSVPRNVFPATAEIPVHINNTVTNFMMTYFLLYRLFEFVDLIVAYSLVVFM